MHTANGKCSASMAMISRHGELHRGAENDVLVGIFFLGGTRTAFSEVQKLVKYELINWNDHLLCVKNRNLQCGQTKQILKSDKLNIKHTCGSFREEQSATED